jgi:hypothetical protein
VNALWFLSLVISLTCALLATFLQQWARRYLKVTQSRYSPHKRARIRAFFFEGVENLLLPWAVELLPMLLHISLFLFFAGLVVFLSNVNLTIFKLVLSWVSVCVALYGCITLMPILRHDSPYSTSLSSLAWPLLNGMGFLIWAVSGFLVYWTFFCRRRGAEWFFQHADRCYHSLSQGMQKTAEETALKSPPEIDIRLFRWTFDCLDEDHELERFFAGLPGFRSSKVVADPLPRLFSDQRWRLSQALTGLLDRTLSSDLLPAPIKQRRAIICVKAIDRERLPYLPTAFGILAKYQCTTPLAIGIVEIMRGWQNSGDKGTALHAQAVISMIVVRAQPRDDSWFILASYELGIPEAVLRDYAMYGDSLSLAILIHITRQQLSLHGELHWPKDSFSKVLEAASEFNVQDTSPDLQHHFCALWNQIVHQVQNGDVQDGDARRMVIRILSPVRNVYIALHQDTNSAPTQFSASTDDRDYILWEPSSYPVCNVAGHHPDTTSLTSHDRPASTTMMWVVPHDDAKTALVSSLLPGAPPLDDNLSLSINTKSHRIPFTSPNPVTTSVIHGNIDASERLPVMSRSSPEPSASLPPFRSKSSTSPSDLATVEHTSVGRAASGDLTVPSSASPALVLDDIPPTGLLSPSYSAVTGPDLIRQ